MEDVLAIAEKRRSQLVLGTLSHIIIIISVLHVELCGFSPTIAVGLVVSLQFLFYIIFKFCSLCEFNKSYDGVKYLLY